MDPAPNLLNHLDPQDELVFDLLQKAGKQNLSVNELLQLTTIVNGNAFHTTRRLELSGNRPLTLTINSTR